MSRSGGGNVAKVSPGVYKKVLRVREAYPFDIACLLMRFFGSMLNIGVVTMITLSGYSFLTAGLSSSLIALSIFVVTPRVSKRIDERGQSAVVPKAAAVSLLGLVVLIANVALHGRYGPCSWERCWWGSSRAPRPWPAPDGPTSSVPAAWARQRPICAPCSPTRACSTTWRSSSARPSLSRSLPPSRRWRAWCAAASPFAVGVVLLCSAKGTEPYPGWSQGEAAGSAADVVGAAMLPKPSATRRERARLHRRARWPRAPPPLPRRRPCLRRACSPPPRRCACCS